jgi:hypothetical protein
MLIYNKLLYARLELAIVTFIRIGGWVKFHALWLIIQYRGFLMDKKYVDFHSQVHKLMYSTNKYFRSQDKKKGPLIAFQT